MLYYLLTLIRVVVSVWNCPFYQSHHIQPCLSFSYEPFWLSKWKLIFFFWASIVLFLFLAVLGLHCCVGFSLVVTSRGYSLVVVHRLLIVEPACWGAWASVVAAYELSSCCSGFWSTGSVVVACGLSCSAACGFFLDQGSNLCLPHWQVASLPLSHQGSPHP